MVELGDDGHALLAGVVPRQPEPVGDLREGGPVVVGHVDLDGKSRRLVSVRDRDQEDVRPDGTTEARLPNWFWVRWSRCCPAPAPR